jgi:hypothetical protein
MLDQLRRAQRELNAAVSILELVESSGNIGIIDQVRHELNELYSKVWTQCCYDPDSREISAYAETLLPHVRRLNDILKFKP